MENLNLDVKDLIDDPDMQSVELDEIKLSRSKTVKGLILFLVCSIIGIRCILRICHSCRWEF